ncbi:MAG: hypothetical protein P4N60_09735 [Verrucomicrobiae bacterium]|nr:hypothetical protein [Verrucomicrobiae bacterium]
MNREANPSTATTALGSFRRLAWNELVKRGDYIEDGKSGFEPWVGPTGFHADSFIKTIYRKYSPRRKAEPKPA